MLDHLRHDNRIVFATMAIHLQMLLDRFVAIINSSDELFVAELLLQMPAGDLDYFAARIDGGHLGVNAGEGLIYVCFLIESNTGFHFKLTFFHFKIDVFERKFFKF